MSVNRRHVSLANRSGETIGGVVLVSEMSYGYISSRFGFKLGSNLPDLTVACWRLCDDDHSGERKP